MGVFQVELEIGDPQGEHFETVDALVDSGATYTTLPEPLLRKLGVVPLSSANFILADGSRMERGIGQTWMRLEGEEFIVPVVFGPEATQPLLGAVTLEIFRLGIDPVRQRLIPVDGLLLVNTESRLDAAILLYQQDEVTLSRAAELAGIHRFEFEAGLEAKGVAKTVEVDEALQTGVSRIKRQQKSNDDTNAGFENEPERKQ